MNFPLQKWTEETQEILNNFCKRTKWEYFEDVVFPETVKLRFFN